jgi:hypothetical protein
VGVMPVGDSAGRVAEDFDRRLGNVLVVECRARLAQGINTLLNNSVQLGSLISTIRYSTVKSGLYAG